LALVLALVVSAAALVGCGSGPAVDPKGNVIIYLANESPELRYVDVTVEVDGRKMITDTVENGERVTPNISEHRLRLPLGRHTLVVRSSDGRAELRRSFTVTGRRWVAISYWYNTGAYGTPTPRSFDILIRSKQILFQ
jgi:hypothetical protein